jgi:hypothetical protein
MELDQFVDPDLSDSSKQTNRQRPSEVRQSRKESRERERVTEDREIGKILLRSCFQFSLPTNPEIPRSWCTEVQTVSETGVASYTYSEEGNKSGRNRIIIHFRRISSYSNKLHVR